MRSINKSTRELNSQLSNLNDDKLVKQSDIHCKVMAFDVLTYNNFHFNNLF